MNLIAKVPLSIGSGISIFPQGLDLLVTAVDVRFSQIKLLGECVIKNYRGRPAADCGREYAAFVQRLQVGHLAASMLLPREATTLRVLSLPPLKRKDLHSAIELQAGSLHPYPEDDVCFAWSRVGKRNDILMALSRRTVVGQFRDLFHEAGIAVASFTVSAAVLHAAIHFLPQSLQAEFGAFEEIGGIFELYGESRSRALFSAALDASSAQFESQVRSQLRLSEAQEIRSLRDCLPPCHGGLPTNSIAYAAALCAATPLRTQPLNLLPETSRASNSRLRYLPTAVLAASLLICACLLLLQERQQRRSDELRVADAIHALEPKALETQRIGRQSSHDRARLDQIDSFRSQSKQDLDAINELTRVLPAPVYLTSLDLTRVNLTASGQASSAAGLLNEIDSSPLFKHSVFTSDISRAPGGEQFRLKAERKTAR